MAVGREAQPVVVPDDPSGWHDHVIVCGLSDVALRTIEQLDAIGERVVVIDEEASARRLAIVDAWGIPCIGIGRGDQRMLAAGLPGASAVVCAGDSDLRTLETALHVRDQRPDVRIVVHLDNPAVGRAVSQVTGAGSVLDVAALFAPSVIDRCLGRRSSTIRLGSVDFTVAEVTAREAGTLRTLYGALAPVGVMTADDRIVVGPGRDEPVAAGDRVTLLGTDADFAAAGVNSHRTPTAGDVAVTWWQRMSRRVKRAATGVAAGTDHAVRVTLAIGLGVLVFSTIVLHLAYRLGDGSHMSLLNATYFTIETAATVGFGDFSFAHQPAALQFFGICLIVAGTAIVSTLFALVTNALVARRIEQSLGRGQVRHLSGHVVMVGLGSIGMRVLEGLRAQGAEVVVIERDDDNVYINQARSLGTPVVIGDAKLGLTLAAANLTTASAVAIVTSDDLTNLETGLAVRDHLGERWWDVPVILRVFDRGLGHRLESSFDFRHVWSTSAIAAPWFVGAALGFGVLATFYVGNVPFLVARLTIGRAGGLSGVAMRDLGAGVRVVAIRRAGSSDTALEHPPRRDTTFAPGDDAYLAGPYEELLRVVRRERA
jgi:Trk K+ transport system NAD-binding subunit